MLAEVVKPVGVGDGSDQETKLISWIETNIGGTVTGLDRQRRWRPVWRASVLQDGVTRDYLCKGQREWNAHPYPLKYEMGIMKVLEESEIRVPHVFGMCPDPEAIVMEWVQGGRDPGLIQEAIESASVMTDDRWAASLRYMEILADMHRIPPGNFVVAGAHIPSGARETALNSFERFYNMCGDEGVSDPFVEFTAAWLRRNVPVNRSGVSFVTGDCGQFLSEGREVTAVLDVEIGYLGDHLHDLACFRGRHPIENMGDVPELFRHYEASLGMPLDLDALAYHTVVFLSLSYLAPSFAINKTGPGGDWVESAVAKALIGRRCMEALAEILDISLDPVNLPSPEETPQEDMALRKLIAEVDRLPLSPSFADWQRNVLSAIPKYLYNHFHYQRWIHDSSLADVENLLGRPFKNCIEADSELTMFIKGAGAEHDSGLTRLFYARYLRQCLAVAGPGASSEHIALAKMEPILPKGVGRP